MPYFKRVSDGQIVHRKHEFNAESLNGEIQKIEDYADCLLMVHVATKKFTWEVTPMETLNPEDGLKKLKELGTREEAKKGQPFYSLIHSANLQDYISFNEDFEFKEKIRDEIKKEEPKKIITKDPIDVVKKRVDERDSIHRGDRDKKPREGPTYKPKLEREVRGEKPIKILR